MVQSVEVVAAGDPIGVRATEGFGFISKSFDKDMIVIDNLEGDRVVVPKVDLASIFEKGAIPGMYKYKTDEAEKTKA